jgi:hypothetical protein
MRTTTAVLLAILLALATTSPATAGTPEDPEVTDACGQLAPTSTGYKQPANDICAAWFDADVADGAVELAVTIRTLAPTAPGSRYAEVGWTLGDCEHLLVVDDGELSPRPIPVGEGGAVLPEQHPVRLVVRCGPTSGPCYPPVPIPTCTGHERRAAASLPADAVTTDGTDLTITLRPDAVDLSGTPVGTDGDAVVSPGSELTDLHVRVASGPSHLVVPSGGSAVVVSGISVVQFTTADSAEGDRYVVPADPATA